MDKAVNARNDGSKCAERRKTDDFCSHYGADRIIAFENFPRIVFSFLVAERNFLVFTVKRLYVDLHRVTDGNHVRRMFDAAPGELGNVNHTVHAADVDECAVACERTHRAGISLAFFSLCPESFFRSCASFFVSGTDRADNSFSSSVDFNDFELDGLADHIFQRIAAADFCKRRGDKHANAVVLDKQAFAVADNAGHFAFHSRIVVFGKLVPSFNCVVTLFGKRNRTFDVVGLHDNQVQFVADLDFFGHIHSGVIAVLRGGDIAGVFSAGDFDLNFGRCDRNNMANYFLVGTCIYIFLKHIGKAGCFRRCCSFLLFN